MTAAILIERLVSAYDSKRTVIDQISFQVNSGETFGLIGLNGEGKTTLIKTILGLRDPQGGQVSVFGRNPLDPMSRSCLAYLPERFDPPLFLSGMDFVFFSARFYNRTVLREHVEKTAVSLGLDPTVLSRRANTYSKGMRQKLGLIATMASGCDLFILDEPMSGLDPRARDQVKTLLADQRAAGKTVFLSSHILADMDEICDRVAVLHEGHLRYMGPPDGLRARMGGGTLEKAFLSVIEKKRIAV